MGKYPCNDISDYPDVKVASITTVLSPLMCFFWSSCDGLIELFPVG